MTRKIFKKDKLPGMLRFNTVSRQARPVISLNVVRTMKAVEAVRKTKEKRYMRGMMAQPYNISNMNK